MIRAEAFKPDAPPQIFRKNAIVNAAVHTDYWDLYVDVKAHNGDKITYIVDNNTISSALPIIK